MCLLNVDLNFILLYMHYAWLYVLLNVYKFVCVCVADIRLCRWRTRVIRTISILNHIAWIMMSRWLPFSLWGNIWRINNFLSNITTSNNSKLFSDVYHCAFLLLSLCASCFLFFVVGLYIIYIINFIWVIVWQLTCCNW